LPKCTFRPLARVALVFCLAVRMACASRHAPQPRRPHRRSLAEVVGGAQGIGTDAGRGGRRKGATRGGALGRVCMNEALLLHRAYPSLFGAMLLALRCVLARTPYTIHERRQTDAASALRGVGSRPASLHQRASAPMHVLFLDSSSNTSISTCARTANAG
jgi:hypothetical protein